LLAACVAAATLASAAGYRPPRTADGAPDLQGVWDTSTLTFLERPPDFKTLVVPDAAAEAYERHWNDPDQLAADFRKARPNAPDVDGVHTEWMAYQKLARIGGQARSSLLIDPPDGKLPLRPEARQRLKALRLQELRNFDSYEARPLAERCILASGPPLVAGDTFTIVQTRDHVIIAPEGNTDPRIVRLTDRRHGPAPLQPWMGDSVGWWEGDTLVVETTQFNPGHARWSYTSRTPLSPQAKVTERFSRTSPREILYRFTVEDPANYARPWSGVMPFRAFGGRLFEYACHEGNYALGNILAGARRVEANGGTPEPLDGGDPPAKAAAP
jgi:hypothetical protein